MNKTIHAIFENRVFRPIEPIELPRRSQVEFEPRLVSKKDRWPDDFFQQTSGAFAGETSERPTQGQLPIRGEW